MLDALLANQLVKAVAPGTHLLLVGDPDQLPSVGAGNILADLLRSERFPVTRLAWIIHELVRHPVDRHPLLNGRRVGWQQVVIARPW